MALNLSYSGCCNMSLSPPCSNKGCYCDQSCHIWNDCCSDIADIGCYHPDYSSSHIVSTTPTETPVASPGKLAILIIELA